MSCDNVYKWLEIRIAKDNVKMALSQLKMVKVVPRQGYRESQPKFDTKLLLYGRALRLL